MSEVEQAAHEEWLGMVQPSDGLVVSVPVLVEAQCYERHPPALQHTLLALCSPRSKDGGPSIVDLPRFLGDLLALTPELWDAAAGYCEGTGWAGVLSPELSHYAPEGGQTVAPTLALRKQGQAVAADVPADAAQAAARYEMLAWELPCGLPLDKTEAVTGPWEYPPSAKFERLLRAVRVPIGLVVNGEVMRLMYAPAGESTGSLDFRIADMATIGGRPILDAFVTLMGVTRWFGVAPERSLPAMLAKSREYQAEVTTRLGEQVLEALTVLLRGFEAAAERDGRATLDAALARENDHLYHGLLTVLLRMVFVLYAEDRGLLPTDQPLYETHYSLIGLFDQLQADHGVYPDSMARRFGGWGRIVALFRALFLGVSARELKMPGRRGSLFDPNVFAFLEGWDPAGSSPIHDPAARSEVKLPTIDDETLFDVLSKLILLESKDRTNDDGRTRVAQRLSYRALDVEQIGSVYEGLMGFHVKRVNGPAVCTAPDGVWIEAGEVLAVPATRREAWLAQEIGLDKKKAKALAETIAPLKKPEPVFEVLERYAQGRTKEIKARARARAGQLVLQPGQERRRTSSHYTPRSLSAPVVTRALEPLLKVMTEPGVEGPSSERILQLRVCDPAMGSGAFLVEACRYLGEAVEAAWRRESATAGYRDPTLAARRRVAQCCLYGVDKNPVAVELGKLSLWLVTLERSRPFTFMDSNLRHGDSLVGLSLEQIRSFHWQPSRQLELCAQAVGEALDDAIKSRDALIELAKKENGANPDPREKEILSRDADDALTKVRLIADVCLGAFFAETSEKARERERLRRLELVQRWRSESNPAKSAQFEQELRGMQEVLRRSQVPFHWMVEFPDVFWDARRDPLEDGAVNGAAFMDAFIGNPPFLGVAFMTAHLGEGYVPWLQALHSGTQGKFDLSAHFFRRSAALLGRHGTIGLIATNTIAQGDTRATGLQRLVAEGLIIYAALVDLPWPGTAAITVSTVHVAKGHVRNVLDCSLNCVPCEEINSQLHVGPERGNASRLRSSQGASFQGSIVVGSGFVLTPEERFILCKSDHRNGMRIQPYIGGEEVNTSPAQMFERYVINFGELSLEQAEKWPLLVRILRERVKPERDRVRRDAHRKYWWHFGDKRPALYEAIAPLKRCLVTSNVTKHLCFSFQPTERIFSHALYVFPLDHYTAFATLQSRIHEPWTRLLSSSLESRLRYAASDCFDTFPFPKPDPRSVIPALEQAGEALYVARAKYMVDTDQGLTKTYNALKDPNCNESRIRHLRALHEAMDRAAVDAYGWSDLVVPPFCPSSDVEHATLKRFEAELIDRLFALNAERAAAEARLGLGQKPKKDKAKPEAAPTSEPTKRPSLKPLKKATASATRKPTSHPPPPKRRTGTR